VGIDRADDGDAGDAPTRLPARLTDVDAASPLDAGERAVEHARYRARVEDYGPARDASIEALPSLHAAWQRHVERYPERERPTPRTQPDGSWLAGGGRELSPQKNAEASKACADIAEEGKEVILPAMKRIEAADAERHLAGLENMLKGEDRLKEKVADRLRYQPDLTARQAAAEVPDAVRFTLAYSETHYTNGVLADVDRLKAEGFELIKLKNLWAKDQYKGINSQWCRPETGLRFEVQFHTPESLEAKELTHKAYERLRDPLTSKDEERELEDYQRRVNAVVKLPPDVFGIEDYPPEKRDG
jgi:hypothetical protein